MSSVENKPRKITRKELNTVRTKLLDQQGWKCPLCERNMKLVRPAQRCVDHDHSKTGPSAGAIRGVLCANCNGNEGRIRTRVVSAQGSLSSIEWLTNLLDYWRKHTTNQTGLVHPTYKTPEELREQRNKKARIMRALRAPGAKHEK